MDRKEFDMGAGPTITLGFLGDNGEFVAISPENPLPVEEA